MVLPPLLALAAAPLAGFLAGSPADAAATASVPSAAGSYCYQQLSGLPGRTDIEQLRLDLDGVRVAGFYRWFPWKKDRRVGRLQGRLASPGTARVVYRFVQEGQGDSAPLTIVFDDRQATIRWQRPSTADPSSQAQPMPPVLLPRHPCAQLKTVPGL